MKVIGLNKSEAFSVVGSVSKKLYSSNLTVSGTDRSNSRRKRCTFSVSYVGSKLPGMGLRIHKDDLLPSNYACWHAHYDVLDALFRDYPNAIVETKWAVYSSSTFDSVSLASAYQMRGKVDGMAIYPTDLCFCPPSAWPFEENIPGTGRFLVIGIEK